MTDPSLSPHVRQRCINASCAAEFPVDSILTQCARCGEPLDVVYDWSRVPQRPGSFAHFLRPEAGGECSGVWQFRELLRFYREPRDTISIGEGKTILQDAPPLAKLVGLDPSAGGRLHLQYEGLNPSGSFKDNGMAAAFTHARMVGAKVVACASTGNTSASMALYAAQAGMRAIVFVGAGKIAMGKLAQALDYGALTLQIDGDFDACLGRVRDIAAQPNSPLYLMNSVNPFRLEGQKTIMYRVLRDLGLGRGSGGDEGIPDWVIVPGGNLGNCSAFGKAFIELQELGLIKKVPRLAVINAAGARTLDHIYNDLGLRWQPSSPSSLLGAYDRNALDAAYSRLGPAHTIASAIEINRPVNLAKAFRALHFMNGVVRSVSDDDILHHKALIARHGLGCEPASAASVAGAQLLLREGVIKPHETVVCILTGHQLKDPDATVKYHTSSAKLANHAIRVADDPAQILKAIGL